MYICLECNTVFENPKPLTETHGLTSPPYEVLYVCPACKGTNYKPQEIKYCHCCGARLNASRKRYCSTACENKGEKLRRQEQKRYKFLRESYIYKVVREVEEYNRRNNTRLSYGQYVALVMNVKKGKRKNVKG
ncbi:MAG: hypothetical protein IKK55_02155 [Clostridia bacterium]|nr:hypothetical protein [Clostridia bacterium]